MESERVRDGDRTLVPNRYAIHLAPPALSDMAISPLDKTAGGEEEITGVYRRYPQLWRRSESSSQRSPMSSR